MKFLLLLFPLYAFSFSDPESLKLWLDQRGDFRLFEASRIIDFEYEGIAKLSNCSGSLIRFSGQPTNSPGIVLTNGHCLRGGFLENGEVLYQENTNRLIEISNGETYFSYNANKLVYATMTATDIALYQLEATYDEIAQDGIEPFLLDTARPLVGISIDIISGYWQRGYRCHIDGFVWELRESEWRFYDSIRYSSDGCNVIGGTSGSPIIQTDSRVVVGVNNTGNMDGRRCTLMNPCEVTDEGEITVIKGRGYGQQTYQIYGCLTVDFELDLSLDTCELPSENR